MKTTIENKAIIQMIDQSKESLEKLKRELVNQGFEKEKVWVNIAIENLNYCKVNLS